MSEEITESGTIEIHPRYVDPPIVHLEQVMWCAIHYPKKVEAVAIKKGDSLCEECFYGRT
jgi:hypothetical protein